MKRNSHLVWLSIICVVLPLMLQAAVKDIQLNADWAVFRYDAEQAAWELYYSFPQKQVHYQLGDDGSYTFIANMQLKIYQKDSLLTVRGWRRQDSVADTLALDELASFTDRIRLLMDPGDYIMWLVAQDNYHPEIMDSIEMIVHIPEFPKSELSMSDVVVASDIDRNFKDKDDPFYKNTLKVMPNPARVFVPESPFLYFYTELYNLKKGLEGTDFTLNYHVVDGDNNVVDEVKPMSRRRDNSTDTRVEWGAVKVGRLATGSYTLHVGLSNEKGELKGKDVRFFVYNEERIEAAPEAVTMDIDRIFMTSEFATMGEFQLKDVFEKARYITDNEDRRTFKRIKDLEEQRRWLFDFWARKNPVEGLSPVTFYREYIRRVEYVNEEFRGLNLEGWKSDRGRVYIMYGDPTYRHRHPNSANTRPYEEWQYDNLQGGVMFIFADLNQTKEFRLIHSDMRGEIRNDRWEDVLTSGHYR